MKRLALTLALALAASAVPGAAQQLLVGGQLRPRTEFRDPTPGPTGNEALEFTSMRTRVSLQADVLPSVRVFVQFQDVRIWGSEDGPTDASADGLDLHQGWLEVGSPAADRLAVRVGRQELAYGDQRLVGISDFGQQARSFDGVRLRLRPSDGATVDGFVTWVGDRDGGQPDEAFAGLYGVLEAAGSVDVYALYHARDESFGRPGTPRSGTRDLSNTLTVGSRWVSGLAGLDWRLEAAYQAGETRVRGDRVVDVSAYLLAARVGTRLTESLGATLWYDFLSGDDDPGDDTFRTFNTLFATNHGLYGYMDLFTNIPTHTRGRGLQDLALKTTVAVRPGHTFDADVHTFRFATADGLESGHIGEELDLTYRWAYGSGVTFTAGASYFLAGDAAPIPAAPAAEDGMVWGYLMADVVF